MKILIAPNSFKECADSIEIAKIISDVIIDKSSFEIVQKPISDGGDGFLKVIQSLYETVPIVYSITDNNNNLTRDICVLLDKINKSVFIESSDLFGLKVIPVINRIPLKLNSEILGDILLKLAADVETNKYKIDEVWIGIGGTATIDFGIGALAKLGLGLYDLLEMPTEPNPLYFMIINRIENKIIKLPFKVNCIVDVDTDLIAKPGAIEIYGEQKNASEAEFQIIKTGIQHILKIISNKGKITLPQKLNGAGGGLAAGLNIFLGAEIIKAEDFIKNKILQNMDLEKIDAVITGEGGFDFQSFEGKGSGIILKLFSERNIPVFLINGSTNLSTDVNLPKNVQIINLTDYFSSKELSIKNYREGLNKAVQIVLDHLDK
jgi:glycerate 2-kinase